MQTGQQFLPIDATIVTDDVHPGQSFSLQQNKSTVCSGSYPGQLGNAISQPDSYSEFCKGKIPEVAKKNILEEAADTTSQAGQLLDGSGTDLLGNPRLGMGSQLGAKGDGLPVEQGEILDLAIEHATDIADGENLGEGLELKVMESHIGSQKGRSAKEAPDGEPGNQDLPTKGTGKQLAIGS